MSAHSKFTDKQKESAVELVKQGLTRREVALQFGAKRQTIDTWVKKLSRGSATRKINRADQYADKIRTLRRSGMSVNDIMKKLGINTYTYYRALTEKAYGNPRRWLRRGGPLLNPI